MIESLRPFGDLLQVGFAKQSGASKIVAYHPKTHTILEGDPFSLEKAKLWVAKHPQTILIGEIWQKNLPTLGLYDTIYCELTDRNELWPELTRIRYSDRDLETFCETVAKTTPDQLFRFLHELAHNDQITPEQMNKMIDRHKLSGTVPKIKKSCRQMVACLKMCLDSHMRKGSRFGAPLDDVSLVYEDPLFTQIVVDPYVEIREYPDGIVVEKFSS